MYSRKKISINSVLLDHENARHGSIADQSSIYAWMSGPEIGPKVLKLAREIAAKGLSPLETPGVIKDQELGKWVVVEGNRRVAALKFLNKPKLCPDMRLRKQYEKIKQTTSLESKTKIDFVVFDNFEQASYWIETRHGGESGGSGIISWGAIELDNFFARLGKKTQNRPAIELLNYAIQKGMISYDQAKSFPITTLSRLLSTPQVREVMGCDLSRGEIFSISDESYFDHALSTVLSLLASGTENVTTLKTAAQRITFAGKLKDSNDWPNYEARSPHPVNSGLGSDPIDTPSNDEDDLDNGAAQPEAPSLKPKPYRGQHPAHRDRLFTRKTANLSIDDENKKAKGIVAELLILKHSGTKSTPISVAFLLRALIEISTNTYLDRNKQIKPKDPGSLRSKVQACAKEMNTRGVLKSEQLEAVLMHCNNTGDMMNITTLQKYLHDDVRFPSGDVLNQLWDELGVYVSNCWISTL